MQDVYIDAPASGLITPVLAADTLKRLATLRARAALRGVLLHCMPDDTGRTEYIVTQGPWTTSFHAMEDLDRWLSRIEGAQA